MKRNKKNDNILSWSLITAFAAILIFVVGIQNIANFYQVRPWNLQASEYSNNIISPIVSIFTLVGVVYTYRQQQKNHDEQMEIIQIEHSYSFLRNMFEDFTDYKNKRIKEIQFFKGQIIEIADIWQTNFNPQEPKIVLIPDKELETIEDYVKAINILLSEHYIHIRNIDFVVDYIDRKDSLNYSLKNFYLEKLSHLLSSLYIGDVIVRYEEVNEEINFSDFKKIIKPISDFQNEFDETQKWIDSIKKP